MFGHGRIAMTRTLIIQSFRADVVPAWIARCLDSVQAWAALSGYDYRRAGDEMVDLCGAAYLAKFGDNIRAVANLGRLELVRNAHEEGYDLAAWVDADVFVFEPARLNLDQVARLAFARETWIALGPDGRGYATEGVNNSVVACRRGEPDLEFLIAATRHVAAHRVVRDNFQIGGDLIKGLRVSLDFEALGAFGMLNSHVVIALARGNAAICRKQAEFHGEPIYAANLCASANYHPSATAEEADAAIDVLAATRGEALNRWIRADKRLAPRQMVRFRTSRATAAAIGLAKPVWPRMGRSRRPSLRVAR